MNKIINAPAPMLRQSITAIISSEPLRKDSISGMPAWAENDFSRIYKVVTVIKFRRIRKPTLPIIFLDIESKKCFSRYS
ncbi:MAG: hypothetical protein LRY50_16710 [Geovibrio sp.]|nr:hypothetical protein [Geovibrio sp.]